MTVRYKGRCNAVGRCPYAGDCPHGMRWHLPMTTGCESELCNRFKAWTGKRWTRQRVECVRPRSVVEMVELGVDK